MLKDVPGVMWVAMRDPEVLERDVGQFCLKSNYEMEPAHVGWDLSVFSASPTTIGQFGDCLSHTIIVSRLDRYMQIWM